MNWNKDGNSYTMMENGAIVQVSLPTMAKTPVVSADQLKMPATTGGGRFGGARYAFSADQQIVLLMNTHHREYHNTFYTAQVLDRTTGKVTAIGKGLKDGYLLNPELSPNGTKVAFVYDNNIYTQDVKTGAIARLTADGTDKKLNGWFDYTYSEELFCTDGISWSPDSKQVAYWQIDISKVKTLYMINNTDSNYAKLIPLPFAKPGEEMAAAKMGVVNVATKKTVWMKIAGLPSANYLTRMDWLPDGSQLIVQQLNRMQNESRLVLCNPFTGLSKVIYKENDDAWIDVKSFWNRGTAGWDWIENGKAFIWASEKDGWRHLYRIGLDGKETLLTPGSYDITGITGVDEAAGWLYFMASPDNATQRYLYRASLNGATGISRVSPASLPGTHSYTMSPNGKWAQHSFSSYQYLPASEWLSLPGNTPLTEAESIGKKLAPNPAAKTTSFFKVTTDEGIEMDGFMVKPANFDPKKKYPVIFTTYSEPFSTTVNDGAGIGGRRGGFFNVDSGYLFMAVEGRGAPAPKGRAWRKAIYRNLGWINANDQAGAAKKIIRWPFVDSTRIAVYGGSGGASTTMQLLFRYPEIYQTGLASSGVPSQFLYNNVYEERYMGLLPENKADYTRVSPVTYAKNLRGHLLIMHGTGDHNVHYQGEEVLLNELIRYNKQFMFMPYPNRTHGISEGEGTALHKTTLMANFLKQYCPPGGR
ncbi:prolyl oligopeptidase family serine peptidase [Pedobacter sp. HMF7056]|uniref:Prolyl oligopeptidase family serine peptidase n=1 Tax=Hufsiella ginkgonis TaxID=2695274 RepID=A0A7K1Y2R7_9SPHI|nr:prolyl oligopeptidase family serine peptidase [Hufsiella ginkgonis]